jgi:hypothetical protein
MIHLCPGSSRFPQPFEVICLRILELLNFCVLSAAAAILEYDNYPRQLRQCGPSCDVLGKMVALKDAKKRGRWLSGLTVARYEKHKSFVAASQQTVTCFADSQH